MNKGKWGPGMLVTAAFIGPGTVLTASKAGAGFGYGLLWVVLFSVLGAIVFQEMAARLGIVTGKDLSVSLKSSTRKAWLNWLITILVLSAVLVGNAAFQAGNIAGATTGLETLSGLSKQVWAIVIALIAASVLWVGRMDLVQRVLIGLVAFMSILFVVSMIIVRPDLSSILQGMTTPKIEPGGLMMVIALLGTTIVPYNLFLHSQSAVEAWYDPKATTEQKKQAIRNSRIDTSISIGLGGLITMAILVTASVAFFANGTSLTSLTDIAQQLKPVLGVTSEWVFCLGLTAAGLTSAITAPLAAGVVAAGCFGWGRDLQDNRTRTVMFLIIAFGVAVILFSAKGSPSQIILFAQIANGLILPIVAVFLLLVVNQSSKLAEFKNGWLANLLAVVVIVVVSLIAFRQFDSIRGQVLKWFEPLEKTVLIDEHKTNAATTTAGETIR